MYPRKSRGLNWMRAGVGCLTLGLVATVVGGVWMFNLGRATARQLSRPELGLELALERLGLDQPPAGFQYGFDVSVPWSYRITMLSSEPFGATHWDSVGNPGQFFMVTEARSAGEWDAWLENPARLYQVVDDHYREFLEFELGPGRVVDGGRLFWKTELGQHELLYSLRQGGIRPASPRWGQVALIALRCQSEDLPHIGIWAQAIHSAPPMGPPQIVDGLDPDGIRTLVESTNFCR